MARDPDNMMALEITITIGVGIGTAGIQFGSPKSGVTVLFKNLRTTFDLTFDVNITELSIGFGGFGGRKVESDVKIDVGFGSVSFSLEGEKIEVAPFTGEKDANGILTKPDAGELQTLHRVSTSGKKQSYHLGLCVRISTIRV